MLVAKLAMVELAGGFGYRQPRRVVHRARAVTRGAEDAWSGGSSSGSGSAVAAGLVPFAHRLGDVGLDHHAARRSAA